jgi:GR25 family glycosyltransferase involved in LPS biosynthesis
MDSQNIKENSRVILLRRDEERERHVNKHLSQVRTVDAIDHMELNAGEIKRFQNDNFLHSRFQTDIFFHKPLLKGQIASYLSHARLWTSIIDEDLPFLVIFEDDAVLAPDFWKKCTQIFAELPQDFDFVYLFWHEWQRRNEWRRDLLTAPDWAIKGKNHIRRAPPMYGLVGYILSYKGAETLLRYCKPMQSTSDQMVIRLLQSARLKAYTSSEQLVFTVGDSTPLAKGTLGSNIWGTEKC